MTKPAPPAAKPAPVAAKPAPGAKPAAAAAPAGAKPKKKLSLDVSDVSEVLERKISP